MTLISLGTCCNARSHIKLSIRCSFCVPKSDLWLLLPPALRPPLLPPPTLRRHVQAHAPPVPVSALPLRSRACNRSRTQGPSARPCARGSLARPAVHYNSTGTTQLGRSPAIACRRSQAHRTAPHRTAPHCTALHFVSHGLTRPPRDCSAPFGERCPLFGVLWLRILSYPQTSLSSPQ